MARPKKPLISREAAVRTALEIIDSEGYDGFTLDKVARRLKVRTPSLYHHFSGRSDLLTEAARTLLADIPLDADPPAGQWRGWFVTLSLRTYRRILAHPRAAGLLFSYFPGTLWMPAHERGARILAANGVPAPQRYALIRGLEKLVFGMAFADADEVVTGRAETSPDGDRERWPALVDALEAAPQTRVEQFERAVRLMLAGVELEERAFSD